jgi:FkbM family methyltransferase
MSDIWSNTDFPYMCLKDTVRTHAFREAIHRVVRPGDTVVDAGAGTGILSFFAAEAGAGRVLAVEIDPLLAARLRTSIELNGLTNAITVIEGDVREVSLPPAVDVVIAEIIETGLMDEAQAQAIRTLVERGVIARHTTVIPEHYTTYVDLVSVDDRYYGYRIAAPKHEWPFYRDPGGLWHATGVSGLTDRAAVSQVTFRDRIDLAVDTIVTLKGQLDGIANGIRISGHLRLADGVELGPTNALNGDKILHLPDRIMVQAGREIAMQVQYQLGCGLGSFTGRLALEPIAEAS